MNQEEQEKITPQQAKEILQRGGLVVTLEEAGQILEFLYKLANITLDTYLFKESETGNLSNDATILPK